MDNIDSPELDMSMPPFDMEYVYSAVSEIWAEQEQIFTSQQKYQDITKAEELERHNELIAAIKKAGEKGATIVIGDNANGVQIQQNSAGAHQSMDNSRELDLEQVKSVLEEIKEYFDYPQFFSTFGDNTENVKAIVNETLAEANKNGDKRLIQKSLQILRDLSIGVGGSLIASGVLALLGTLPL